MYTCWRDSEDSCNDASYVRLFCFCNCKLKESSEQGRGKSVEAICPWTLISSVSLAGMRASTSHDTKWPLRGWSKEPNGCRPLANIGIEILHRLILARREVTACHIGLVKAGAQAPRRCGEFGEGGRRVASTHT